MQQERAFQGLEETRLRCTRPASWVPATACRPAGLEPAGSQSALFSASSTGRGLQGTCRSELGVPRGGMFVPGTACHPSTSPPCGKRLPSVTAPPTPTQPSSRLTPATKQEARAGQRILFYVNNYTEDVGASEGSRGACTLAWPRRELTGVRQPGRSGPRDSTAARPAPWGRAHASDPDPGRGLSLPFPEQENGGKSAAQPLGRGAPVPFKDALRCDQTFTRTLLL